MRIFCSGIGGIGLSAYAAYQKSAGHTVSGSDAQDSALLADLRSQGIAVSLTQDGGDVPADADLFVHTLAIPDDHPELQQAKTRNIPCRTYFEALGECTSSWKEPPPGTLPLPKAPLGEGGGEGGGLRRVLIAVCGTHGKSSTTAMAAKLLIESGRDPSVILGTRMKELQNRNWRRGNGDAFLIEACEYRHSFLHLSPRIILLTNADGDHFDFFKTHDDYLHAFREFISRLPEGGALITHFSDPYCRDIAAYARCRAWDADRFPLITLGVPGSHMQQNAQLVLALADVLKISQEQAQQSLSSYDGCWRRMELKGAMNNGAIVIDDYGHHPSEVAATLRALKQAHPGRRIVCVFQPHTHDRTLKLYHEFLGAFRDADEVIIPNVYDARPARDTGIVDLTAFVRDIGQRSGVNAIAGNGLEETPCLLRKRLKRDDLVVTMGAGDVWKVGEALLA